MRRNALVAAWIVALGGVALGAWLAEVVFVTGWGGLRWVRGFPRAALIAGPCVSLAVLAAILRTHRSALWRAAAFVALTSGTALLSFRLARSALYELGSRSAAAMIAAGEMEWTDRFLLENLGLLAAAAMLSAVAFTAASRILLVHLPWWTAGVFLGAVALVIPASMLTIRVVPALNGATNLIHAIKMGYPVFWATVLMGVAAWVGAPAPASHRPERASSAHL